MKTRRGQARASRDDKIEYELGEYAHDIGLGLSSFQCTAMD